MTHLDMRIVRDIEPDFVRGIAILLAMGWHFNGIPTSSPVVAAMLAPGRTLGWAGVDMFFVLSGYLIGTLIFREHQKTRDFRVCRFLTRRALKIWPVFYAYLAVRAFSGVQPLHEWFFQNALHVQNFFGAPIPHLWSLAVEEHFYLLFAISFVFINRSAGRIRKLPLALVLILLTSPIIRSIAVAKGVTPHNLQIISIFRMDSLAAGVLLAYMKAYHRGKFETMAARKLLLLLITVFGVVILARADAHGAFICSLGYSLAYLTGGAFLLFCYRHKFLLTGNIFIRIVAGIGVFSYGLYVWHVSMLRITDVIMSHLPFKDPTGLTTLGIRYGGALVLAVIVTKLVEIPFLRIRDRIFPPITEVKPTDADTASYLLHEILQKEDGPI